MSHKWDLRKRVHKHCEDIEDNAELIVHFCLNGANYIRRQTLQNTAKDIKTLDITNEIDACNRTIVIMERLIKVLKAEDHRRKTAQQLYQAEHVKGMIQKVKEKRLKRLQLDPLREETNLLCVTQLQSLPSSQETNDIQPMQQ
jgi:uncharacterized membrane protein YgaE (UPF0421/DUF939 family)